MIKQKYIGDHFKIKGRGGGKLILGTWVILIEVFNNLQRKHMSEIQFTSFWEVFLTINYVTFAQNPKSEKIGTEFGNLRNLVLNFQI